MTDDARLLPRFRVVPDAPEVTITRRVRKLRDHLRQIDQRDSDTRIVVEPGAPPDAVERLKRRGIPVIGGVSGTQPGTNPLAEVLRSDRRRRYG